MSFKITVLKDQDMIFMWQKIVKKSFILSRNKITILHMLHNNLS